MGLHKKAKVTDFTRDANALPSDVRGVIFYNSDGRQIGNKEQTLDVKAKVITIKAGKYISNNKINVATFETHYGSTDIGRSTDCYVQDIEYLNGILIGVKTNSNFFRMPISVSNSISVPGYTSSTGCIGYSNNEFDYRVIFIESYKSNSFKICFLCNNGSGYILDKDIIFTVYYI